MKTIITSILLLIFISIKSQTTPFNYSIKLKPVTVTSLPGLHSFVVAQSANKWLIIGGRKDGLHARQPFNAFNVANSNNLIYVIDVQTNQFWTAPLTSLSTALQEQLQSSNMNFYQDKDSLYIIGGYGYSNTAANHITYANLTSVSVSGLMNAVINAQPITSYFKQITDQQFAVNGGQLGKIGSTFYLVGGHRFDGRYNPMGNNTYTQTYVNGIKSFQLNNSGNQLSFSNYSITTNAVHLHRRDYNLMPQIFPNREEGYTISSGVFQVGVDLPFLYPVDIKASGYTAVTGFNQYLSNYHCAKVAMYDSTNNVMHSVFFGGISQYYMVNNTMVQDNSVPFVKTISRVSRDANGNLQENVLPIEMPALLGSSAEFISNHNLPHYESDIIKLSQIPQDSILLGHIVGGIYSPQLNPFTNNATTVTNAHTTIYEVWLYNQMPTSLNKIDGSNPIKINVFPNPVKGKSNINIDIPYSGELSLYITDIKGDLVHSTFLNKFKKGKQTFSFDVKLPAGVYHYNFVFDGKFSVIQKVIILE